MTTQHNGAPHPVVSPTDGASDSPPLRAHHRIGPVAAVVNVAGDLHLEDSAALFASANHNLTLNDGGGSVFVAGEDFHFTNGGCAGVVAGRDFSLRNGGCGFVLAGRDVSIANGKGAVNLAGQRAATAGHQSALIAAREVALHQSKAGVIVAGNVTLAGDATVVIEVTPERVAGAIVGLLFYLPVRLLQALQGK